MKLLELIASAAEKIFQSIPLEENNSWRELHRGEILISGDEYFLPAVNRWIEVSAAVGLRPADFPIWLKFRRPRSVVRSLPENGFLY